VLLLLVSTSSQAAIYSDKNGTLGGCVALLSDYSPRGVSLSNKHPAPHLNLNYTHNTGAYADGKITRIDLNDGDQAGTETILAAGFKKNAFDLTFDVSGIGYIYAGADRNRHYNFNEGRLAVIKNFGFAIATVSVNYSPDYFAASGVGLDRTLHVLVPVKKNIAVFGKIARQSVSNNPKLHLPDYSHWLLGASYTVEGITFIGQYVDTSMQKPTCGGGCGPRGIFAALYSF
jgi:uncharacterized protein (TIGR02001 family)